jgi:catechol 2,3-dioxygenase-like lactoylglutathione lyase family enzyme
MITHMDTSIRFYTETLGLTLKSRYGDHWAEIEAPGLTIGLHPTSMEIIPSNNLQMGFRVKNLEEAVADLKAKGVVFASLDDENIRLASFTDPDGNAMYLGQTN